MHTPTLRVTKSTSANEEQAIWIMRAAYMFVTGKEAFPAEDWNESRRRK
jgi:hypothetical protein